MVGATAFEDLCQLLLTDFETGKLKSDEDMLKQLRLNIKTNYIFANHQSYPDQFSDIFEAYNLQGDLANPSAHPDEIGALIGNTIFDIPSIYLPLATYKSNSSARVWLYRYSMTNTYPASHSYRKAHHGVNDLLLFNPAPDMIPAEDRTSWDAGVLQTQKSWIEFTNGESPWTPVRRESSIRAASAMGPIFHFADHGKSREFDTLRECVGEKLARRYDSVLQMSRLTL